jgi:hypothetical protein
MIQKVWRGYYIRKALSAYRELYQEELHHQAPQIVVPRQSETE